MTKTRLFTIVSLAIAAAAGIGASAALAGPWHPCDDRVYFTRGVGVGFGFARPIVYQPVFARPVVVQAPVVVQGVAPATSTVVSVPAGSDVRISTPTSTTIVSSQAYQAAWADAGNPVVVASPATPIVTSPSVIVVPNDPIIVQDTVVEPFDAHDRLVVLNEFTYPNSNGRALLYRDASGLLHERTVYGSSGIFYDHLGRRCRYDHDRSTVVILDDRIVRDYNRNGVCDDDRYVDLHRRAELDFHRSTIYRPAIGTDWRDRYRRVGTNVYNTGGSYRPGDYARRDNTPSYRDDRPADVRRLTVDRPAGPAVNGRLRDDSRLTGNDRKPQNTGARPKR